MDRSIVNIAESFGLTVETAFLPDDTNAFKVFKGAKQIFIGTEDAVREYLDNYESSRPGLLDGSMYGYKE